MYKIPFFLCLVTSAVFAITPDEALNRLVAGNKRYQADALTHTESSVRREATFAKQSPYAVIIGCSDSRVPPEIVFDEGIGDLFVVRVAGNVIAPVGLDSVEYAAIYLGSSVVLVMGHENCGAVGAVVDGTTKDIEAVATLIEPSVMEAKKDGTKNLLERAIKDNAKHVRDYLIGTPVLKKLILDGKIAVHAAYYNLETGSVELL